MEHGMIGQEGIDHAPLSPELGQLPHALQVGGALGVQVALGRPAQHQRQHDLGEQHRLQVGLGVDRLVEPRFYLGLAGLGDGVALAVGAFSGLDLAGLDLVVPHEARQCGVDLAEGEGLAPAEVGVVLTLQLIAVARLTIEEAQEGDGNAHTERIR